MTVVDTARMPVTVSADDPAYTAAPPPWTLEGSGVVLLFGRPADSVLERWVPESLHAAYVGGPAALMLVDYVSSPAGPYRELLFVPGRFRVAGGVRPIITRIVVSTWESVANGRLNWAIPKETAEFKTDRTSRAQRWEVSQGTDRLAEISVTGRGPAFPVTTALLPGAWTTVAQPRNEDFLLTSLASRGRCRVGRCDAIALGPSAFPDLAPARPGLTLVVERFQMKFPVPVVV
ncbi:MAG: acetoacetate decarboxylase family protein [Pseudomonadota bacterium]